MTTKNAQSFPDRVQSFFKNIQREDNIHMLIGIILLAIGLRQLRQRIVGLILIVLGMLFMTGYFESQKK